MEKLKNGIAVLIVVIGLIVVVINKPIAALMAVGVVLVIWAIVRVLSMLLKV